MQLLSRAADYLYRRRYEPSFQEFLLRELLWIGGKFLLLLRQYRDTLPAMATSTQALTDLQAGFTALLASVSAEITAISNLLVSSTQRSGVSPTDVEAVVSKMADLKTTIDTETTAILAASPAPVPVAPPTTDPSANGAD